MVWKSNLPCDAGSGPGAAKHATPAFEWGPKATDAPHGARGGSASPARPRTAPAGLPTRRSLSGKENSSSAGNNSSQTSIGSKGALKAVLLQQQKEQKDAMRVALLMETGVAGAGATGAASSSSSSGAKSSASRIPVRSPTPKAAASAATAAPAFSSSESSSASAQSMNNTLSQILSQLDLVTKTIISMEGRLTQQENRLAAVFSAGVAAAGGSGSAGADITEAGAFDEEDEEGDA